MNTLLGPDDQVLDAATVVSYRIQVLCVNSGRWERAYHKA